MSDPGNNGALLAALARIEERQTAYELAAHRVIGMLEVHNEKLDAILEAASQQPGPSPVADALAAILSSLREQETLLLELPGAIATTIRGEFQRDAGADHPDISANPPARAGGGPGRGGETC
jgi:hypothetical protein